MKYIVHFKFLFSSSKEPTWIKEYDKQPPVDIHIAMMKYSTKPKFDIHKEFEEAPVEVVEFASLVFTFDNVTKVTDEEMIFEYIFDGVKCDMF